MSTQHPAEASESGAETATRKEIAEQVNILSQREERLRERPTKYETRMLGLLASSKEQYIFQKVFPTKNSYAIADFWLPERRVCMEIDGRYHNKPKHAQYDAERDKQIEELWGAKTIRIQNKEVDKMKVEDILNLLDKYKINRSPSRIEDNAKRRAHDKLLKEQKKNRHLPTYKQGIENVSTSKWL